MRPCLKPMSEAEVTVAGDDVAACLSCNQRADDNDKDLLPKKHMTVKWHKKNIDKATGQRTKLCGKECYSC